MRGTDRCRGPIRCRCRGITAPLLVLHGSCVCGCFAAEVLRALAAA